MVKSIYSYKLIVKSILLKLRSRKNWVKTTTLIVRTMSKDVRGRHVCGRAGDALSSASSGASSSRVHVRVIVRVSGRQRGRAVRGSVRVREHVVVSASGQAAGAARKSRDEIRLG